MPDPASWLVIEPGWKAFAADGSEIGTVEEALGEPELDIFAGLAVATRLLGKPVYVPAERVAEIREGAVTLDLSPDEAKQLQPYEPPRLP
jgi:hypothetical protein